MEIEINSALNDMKYLIHYIFFYVKRECYCIINSEIGKEPLIYYTSAKPISSMLDNWKYTDCNIQYYSVNDCTLMFQNEFNTHLKNMFRSKRTPGIKKVFMFKLAMMYIKNGFVIDPNIIPCESLESLKDDNINSYIVISDECRMNVMMMANTSTRRSVLFLTLFLAYIYANKYNCKQVEDDSRFLYEQLAYCIGTHRLKPDTSYIIEQTRYTITIGHSTLPKKTVDLCWFPHDQLYTIEPHRITDKKRFAFEICNNKLYISCKKSKNWNHSFEVDIVFSTNEILYTLAEEVKGNTMYKIKKDNDTLLHCDTRTSL